MWAQISSGIAVMVTPIDPTNWASSMSFVTCPADLVVGSAWDGSKFTAPVAQPVSGAPVRVNLGATHTVPSGTSLVRFVQTGAVAASTITLPSSPQDGDAIQFVMYGGSVLALTFSPAVDGWGNGTLFAARSGARIRWDQADATWHREQ